MKLEAMNTNYVSNCSHWHNTENTCQISDDYFERKINLDKQEINIKTDKRNCTVTDDKTEYRRNEIEMLEIMRNWKLTQLLPSQLRPKMWLTK